MPTKTDAPADETHLESPNVIQTVKVRDNWSGTAIELLRVLEETDDQVARIEIGTDIGRPKVTVYPKYGADGDEGAVPQPLHKQLSDYGYQHVGEGDGHASYTHRDETNAHVYKKED